MPDITMCEGKECPIKNQCYRYTANPSDYQSYFAESPWDGEKCEMFWGENAQGIYEQLKSILNDKNTGD